MQRGMAFFAVGALVFLCGLAPAQTVVCNGHVCGGTGACGGDRLDYVYRATASTGAMNKDTLFIGTDDPVIAHYSQICMPTGWGFTILSGSESHHLGPTAHGYVAATATGTCPYVILFYNISGTPLSPSTPTDFGFNHSGYPHDVGWRLAGTPSTFADWNAAVGLGVGPVHGPKCDTLCETGTIMTDTCLAGNEDNFSTADGPEPSSPSPALLAVMQATSGGADPFFDSQTNDRCFGHSFELCWDPNQCVIDAQLCFKATPISGAQNDYFTLREDGAIGVWSIRFALLKAYVSNNPADTFWTVGDTIEVCLDLDSMPPSATFTPGLYFPTNILATLQDGDLDVATQDDTKIDYLKLFVETCCDSCINHGDINNDGIPLAVADLAYLTAFINNQGPAPHFLCAGDLTGDCRIDQDDIDILKCYFVSGIPCFPFYPVVTCCVPDTSYQPPDTGACCLWDHSCVLAVGAADCANISGGKGVYFPGLLCTPNPCSLCVKPPKGLLAWWPLNDGVSTIGKDVAGAHHGTIPCGTATTVPVPAGKVGGAARFNHNNTTPLRVWDDPFDEIGSGDFTIDAWIFPEALPSICQVMTVNLHCEYRIILDNHTNNRNMFADHQWHGNGVTFFVKNPTPALPPYPGAPGQLGLVMNNSTFLSTTAPVVLNQWQHVAVTVSRTAGIPAGIFYYNGVALPPNPFTPISGGLYFSGLAGWPRMDIGHSTPLNCSGCGFSNDYFNGVLDEVQIFDRALDANEIQAIHYANEKGKCRSYCNVPRTLTFCPSDNTKPMTLTIYNETDDPITYGWSIFTSPGDCPPGIVGNFSGSIPFTTPTSLSVAAHDHGHATITVNRPSGFGVGNIACYTVLVTNQTTGDVFRCYGSIKGVSYIFCPWVWADPVTGPPAPFGITPNHHDTIDFYVTNTSGVAQLFEYRIKEMSSCACDSATGDGLISLNWSVPGGDILGSVNIPAGDTAQIRVDVELVNYRPFYVGEIVLEDDFDDDGVADDGPSIPFHPVALADCNKNGVDDSTDIAGGFSTDANGNGIPDECEFAASDLCCLCGDANADTSLNIGDAVYLINYIFKGGPAPNPRAAGDANGDCSINIGDAVYLINYIFKGGPPPICSDVCMW